jgi:hypothetical protein
MVLGLILLSPASEAYAITYTSFTPIDGPGAFWTEAYGINDSDNIVGYYGDATWRHHGFLLAEGNFQKSMRGRVSTEFNDKRVMSDVES